MKEKIVKDHLDEEWVQLILEAKQIGLTAEQIKLFLKKVHASKKNLSNLKGVIDYEF